ncbi:MAG: hypothetical protein AB1791_20155 [Chloroflexota bacterium]
MPRLSHLLLVLWLFGGIAAYFWAHKPFDSAILAGLGRTLANIAAWLGLTWLGGAIGWRLAGRCLDSEPAAVRLALTIGLGLGCLSLLMLGLGLVGLLRPAVAWIILLTLALLLRRDLGRTLAAARAMRLPLPAGRFQWGLASFIAASLCLTFLATLAPPTAWDALVYHLTGPALYVQAGRISHPIDLPYLGFPQLGEMQFTLGLLLAGDGVAALLHFGYGLLAVVVTASLLGHVCNVTYSWLAAALLVSVPSFLALMSWPYVDVTLLFYVTAATYLGSKWQVAGGRWLVASGRWQVASGRRQVASGRWQVAGGVVGLPPATCYLLLTGVLAGFCVGVKYTAVLVPIILGLSLLWVSRREGVKVMAWRVGLLAAGFLPAALPWLIENWLTTGNPVYPFFLPGRYWDEWRGWWYDRPGTGLAFNAPWRLLIAPLEATILGTEGSQAYDATIGPLIGLALPLLAAVWSTFQAAERRVVLFLLFFLGSHYALWLAGLARSALLLQTRLLAPVFGLTAALGALALDRLREVRRRQLAVDWLAKAAVSLTLAFLFFTHLAEFLQINPTPVALGLESRDHYLGRRLGAYPAVIAHLNTLPAGSRILFLWEPRSYGCRVECLPDALLDRFLHETHYGGRTADSLAAGWRAEGISHVLLRQAGMQFVIAAGFDPVTPRDLAIWAELESRYLTAEQRWGEEYTLYGVSDE